MKCNWDKSKVQWSKCTDILIYCAIYNVSTLHKTYVICVCVKFVQLTLFQHCIKHMPYVSVQSLVKQVTHTCQVLEKSKSEIARGPLIFAYNLVIDRAEKSGAQVLRVRFFSLFKQTKITNTERNKQYCFALPISFTINNPESIISVNLQCSIRIQFLFFTTYNAFLPMTVTQIKIQKG